MHVSVREPSEPPVPPGISPPAATGAPPRAPRDTSAMP